MRIYKILHNYLITTSSNGIVYSWFDLILICFFLSLTFKAEIRSNDWKRHRVFEGWTIFGFESRPWYEDNGGARNSDTNTDDTWEADKTDSVSWIQRQKRPKAVWIGSLTNMRISLRNTCHKVLGQISQIEMGQSHVLPINNKIEQ